MDGNGVSTSSGSCAQGGRQGQPTTSPPPENDGIWLCPAVVSLSAAEIEAALYAFSDLPGDVADATSKAVREELSFIVARYGTVLIECAAGCLATGGPASIPRLLSVIGLGADDSPSHDRMTWCQAQSAILLRAQAA